jgi:hypothetical protein
MLSVIKLTVVMLDVIKLSVVMLMSLLYPALRYLAKADKTHLLGSMAHLAVLHLGEGGNRKSKFIHLLY